MTLRKLMLAGLFSLFATTAFATCPNPVTGKDAAGTTQSFGTVSDASANCASEMVILDASGARAATVKAASTPAAQTDTAFVMRDADIGTPGDTACTTDNGSCTIDALLQRIAQRITSLITATPGAITGFALEAGHLATIDTATATNNTNVGPPGATVCATDTGSCSLNALIQRLNQRITALISATPAAITGYSTAATQGATTDTPTTLPASGTAASEIALLKAIANAANAASNLAAASTGGCTEQTIFTAASNNATVIGTAAAHTLCYMRWENTTTSLFSIRSYDTATTPAAGAPCNSATNLRGADAAQSNATSPGAVVNEGTFGSAFASGLVICITGLNAANDNTNAVTGLNLVVGYK